MTYEELKDKITLNLSSIRLYEPDYEVISKYAALVEPPNWCIDIGTYMGGSSEVMLLSSKPEVKIYSVDTRELVPKEYQERTKDRIRFDFKDSAYMGSLWTEPVGLLFIDGDHSKAIRDFNAWEKHVVPGGYVLFHDFHPAMEHMVKDCITVLNNTNYKMLHFPDLRAIWEAYSSAQPPKETVIFQFQKIKNI
jgi:predicted O-methyltransferase YrrM